MAREDCKRCSCKLFRSEPGGDPDFCVCDHTKRKHEYVMFGTDGGSPRFGAIAYSESTGRYGWFTKALDQEHADKAALSACRAADAKILTAGHETYLALALADNRACGWGRTTCMDLRITVTVAMEQALANCRGPNSRIVLLLVSSERRPIVR
jgi:uncharacterized protein DUF4189